MSSPTRAPDFRHAQFLDLCLLYGDFNRHLFLKAILQSFVDSASPAELKTLRRAIHDRANTMKRNTRKGRPRAEQDPHWIRRSLQIVWQKEILHWPWRRIAAAAGLKFTKANVRTLQIRRDLYAQLVHHALPPFPDQPHALARLLDSKPIQRALRSRLFLPFDSHPEECRRIVLALASQEKQTAFLEVARRFRQADDPKEAKRLGRELGRIAFGE